MGERLTLEDFDDTPAVELDPAAEATSDKALKPSYSEDEGGFIWHKQTKEGEVPTALTNFTARIVIDTVVDNGAVSSRTFTLAAELGEYSTTFEIPAARFAMMNWYTEYLGSEALVYPGFTYRDHARAAIQIFSMGHIKKRRVYAHLGWRKHDEE